MSDRDPRNLWVGAAVAFAVVAGLAARGLSVLRSDTEAAVESEAELVAGLQLTLRHTIGAEPRPDDTPPAVPLLEPAAEPAPSLPAGPDVVGTLQRVQGLGDATGVAFDSLRALRATTPGRQPFVVVGRGAPADVCTFLAGLEAAEPLLVIENGRVLPADAGRIAFELGISTFHEEAR